MLFVVLGSLVGCAQRPHDGVLWRQVAAFTDPLGKALNDAIGTERSAFVTSLNDDSGTLPGRYWSGVSNPANLSLDSGGLVLFDSQDNSSAVMFDVLISSGPRNPDADPLADSSAYSGPSAVYTCFVVTVEFDTQTVTGWTYDDGKCTPRLVETLGNSATPYPIGEFAG